MPILVTVTFVFYDQKGNLKFNFDPRLTTLNFRQTCVRCSKFVSVKSCWHGSRHCINLSWISSSSAAPSYITGFLVKCATYRHYVGQIFWDFWSRLWKKPISSEELTFTSFEKILLLEQAYPDCIVFLNFHYEWLLRPKRLRNLQDLLELHQALPHIRSSTQCCHCHLS